MSFKVFHSTQLSSQSLILFNQFETTMTMSMTEQQDKEREQAISVSKNNLTKVCISPLRRAS